MNTFITVSVYREPDAAKANAAIDAALDEIRRIEAMATDYNDSSNVGRINRGSGLVTVGVPAELAALIGRSNAMSAASDGAFDVTVGPVVKAWDFLAETPWVIPPDSMAALLRLVDYRAMTLTDSSVFLARRGAAIDLGAIAKGYAVDRAVAILRARGIGHCIVDLGGNLGMAWEGTHTLDSTAASILIRHPRNDGAFFGRFRCGTGGVSTSGDYQRCFFVGGKRYHHILDPSTGYPSPNAVSVTVVAGTSELADALSTTLFVLGPERGTAFLDRFPGTEALFVLASGDSLRWTATPGLRRLFEPGNPGD
jgi:thiamine biosynthesis lipoprotein